MVHKLLLWISALVIACAAMASVAPAAQAAPTELSIQPSSTAKFYGFVHYNHPVAPADWDFSTAVSISTFFPYGEVDYFRGQGISQDSSTAFIYDVSSYDIPASSLHLNSSFGMFRSSNILLQAGYPSGSDYGYYFAWCFVFSDGTRTFFPSNYAHFASNNRTGDHVTFEEGDDLFFNIDTDVEFSNIDSSLEFIVACVISTDQGWSYNSGSHYPCIAPLTLTYDPDAAFQDGLLGILRAILEFFIDTLPEFFGTIIDAIMMIPESILQGIHDAFVPDTQFMLEFTDDKEELLEEQFGAIWDAVDIITDVYEELTDNFGEFGNDTFHFPGIDINLLGNHFVIEEAEVPYWPGNLENSKFQSAVRFLLSGMLFFAWITGMVRIYERRFGISQEDSADPEEEEPY